MSHTVIGTAGHIDHGKTLLVKGLTGTDTDQAPEEKARGITIELGFAFMGEDATIIDVPGHERFVKTMVAGVSTIDVALLLIAADDSVMPQSREHLDVLQLMGVKRGIVVINKVDLVDDEWLELVEDDVCELVAGTFLEGAQMFRVSALTGKGLPELKEALLEMVADTEESKREGPFRLPVDRSFLVKGFGLVCTGTVLAGQLGGRDTVVVQPSGTQLRVRSLQRHGLQVDQVGAGDRAAVNLPGVEQGEVDRGDLLTEPGFFETTYMLDARLQLLTSCPKVMVQRTRVRLHLGTREVMARVTLLDRDVLAPGESGLVQLRLESPAVAVWGDRFVIRRYSPALTIGGGTILEPHPVKHRQSETGISAQLEALEGEDIVQAMAAKLLLARADAVDMRALAGDLGLNLPGVGAAADELVDAGLAIRVQVDRGEGLAHTERWNSLQTRAETGLAAFHADNPLKRGLNREELRARTGRGIPMGLFEQVLKEMERKGTITVDGSAVRLAAHQIRFSPEEEKLRDSIEGELKKADFAHMPDISQLAEHLGAGNKEIESVLRALERLGAVVFLEPTLVVHRDSVEVVREKLRHELRQKAEITVSEFRELIGSNRRYALALLNRFDGEGLTVRQGDLRTLR
mgnify:FL=1